MIVDIVSTEARFSARNAAVHAFGRRGDRELAGCAVRQSLTPWADICRNERYKVELVWRYKTAGDENGLTASV